MKTCAWKLKKGREIKLEIIFLDFFFMFLHKRRGRKTRGEITFFKLFDFEEKRGRKIVN